MATIAGIGGDTSFQKTLDPGRLFTTDPYTYDSASQQLADLSYYNWQQAASLMYPAEQQLLQYAEDPNYVINQRNQAQTDFNTQFTNAQSARSRFYASQGITLNSQQQAAVSKSDALAKAEGQAGAMNEVTGLAGQIQTVALAGG